MSAAIPWQKSSFSSEGSACLELSRTENRTLRLRESDDPGIVLATSRPRLAALLELVRQHDRLASPR